MLKHQNVESASLPLFMYLSLYFQPAEAFTFYKQLKCSKEDI